MNDDTEEVIKEDQWAKTPGWILDTDRYLPAYYANVPEGQRKKGDDKPLNGGELRTYIAMRTMANQHGRFKAYARTIASRACVDKSTAERAIGKFRRLGWVATRQHRRDDGSIYLCDYVMRNLCPTPDDWGCPSFDGGVPVSSRVGSTRNDGRGTRGSTGVKNRPDEQTKGSDGSEVECSPSGRFAPSGAGDETEDQATLTLEAAEPRTSGYTDWSADDYQLFLVVLGTDKVRSTGGKAGPAGEYPARSLYEGMQKMPDGKKTRPGKYLKAVYDNGGGLTSAVDSWLDRWDLERA